MFLVITIQVLLICHVAIRTICSAVFNPLQLVCQRPFSGNLHIQIEPETDRLKIGRLAFERVSP